MSLDQHRDPELFDADSFDLALSSSDNPLGLFRDSIRSCRDIIRQRFDRQVSIFKLIHQTAWHADQLLTRAFMHHLGEAPCALVAVGGYGRGELHPGSDIDLLLLLPNGYAGADDDRIEAFITFLWDISLEVGHAVRTVSETAAEAARDVTVITNILESRLLCGDEDLYQAMQVATAPDRIWSSREFFAAKLEEQTRRHHRFNDTAYNLEPNVKEGPGGLRDIQVIDWVAKRHFGSRTLHDLVRQEFLTEDEYQRLIAAQDFLWKVRFGLHDTTGRKEDRLLFDHQRTLAARFGYIGDEVRPGVEQFMKEYYRTIMELARLNEMLLQLLSEVILSPDDQHRIVEVNSRFQLNNGYLEIRYPNVFKHYPFAMLEIFLLMAQNPDYKGVRASTIRAIRAHHDLIDEEFRSDWRCKSLFMELLRQPRGITHELRRMNRYGVLARYIPEFGLIVGQMQHDLFHHYTVDEHTLFVLRNLRRFTVPAYHHEFPVCSDIITRVPKPELVYLAALFHDIAKGRGGDHSKLGAEDAKAFCLDHGLSDYDARMVAWLVRHHLLMSVTAQRKDISDAEEVSQFARVIGNQVRLDYLYLLTIADIRATNPGLWNSWRDALLRELYFATAQILRRGMDNLPDQREWVNSTRTSAERLLCDSGSCSTQQLEQVWQDFPDDYFLRYSAERIAWHTEAILANRDRDRPLVMHTQVAEQHAGAVELFIYTRYRETLFSAVTSILDRLGLNIVDARIITSNDGHTLDSYVVLEQNGEPVSGEGRLQEICDTLLRDMDKEPEQLGTRMRHLPRRLKHFPIPTQVSFPETGSDRHTVMEVVAADHPGLLAGFARAILDCGVHLLNAKITTIGERAEDIFFLRDRQRRPISDPATFNCLRDRLVASTESDPDAGGSAPGTGPRT